MRIVLASAGGQVQRVADASTQWSPLASQVPLDPRALGALDKSGIAAVQGELGVLGQSVQGGDRLLDRRLANPADAHLDHARRPVCFRGHSGLPGQRLAYGPVHRIAHLLEQVQLLGAVQDLRDDVNATVEGGPSWAPAPR
ncbi:hypothetical protein AB8B12_30910, partial [Streptomyces sp. PGLac3x]